MTHALAAFIRQRMDERGLRNADIVRASGLSRQLVSKYASDEREQLGRLPEKATLDAFARALGVPSEFLLAKAIEALGIGYTSGDFVNTLASADDAELLEELRARLQRRTTESDGVADDDSDRIEPTVGEVLAARARRAAEASKIIDISFPSVMLDFAVDLPSVQQVAMARRPSVGTAFMQTLGRMPQRPEKWTEALAGVTELYAHDVIGHDELVEFIDEAREIVEASAGPIAARHGVRQRSITDRAQNEAGEENQVRGETEPA